VLDRALEQIPVEHIESLQILVRADSTGATHGLADYCRDANMRFSVGYELTEQVRAAILQIPEDAWVLALDQDGSERANGEVAEITDRVDLSSWPEGSRLIVGRERPHPARSCRSPTTTATASRRSSPTKTIRTSRSSSAATVSTPTSRTGSATTRTPAWPSSRSRSSRSTRRGWRSWGSRTT
jgi:hypothetical protein